MELLKSKIICWTVGWIILLILHLHYIKYITFYTNEAFAINSLVVIIYIICSTIFYLLTIIVGYVTKMITLKNEKRAGKQSLYEWTKHSQSLEIKIKEIIGNEQSSSNILDNMEKLKLNLKQHYDNDIRQLKLFKAYLNVNEKDATTMTFQTFLKGAISSIFVFSLVHGKVSSITNKIIPQDIVNMFNGSELFYDTSAGLFIFSLVLLIVFSMVKNTSKNRVRIFQEVTDMCIKDLEKEIEEKTKIKRWNQIPIQRSKHQRFRKIRIR